MGTVKAFRSTTQQLSSHEKQSYVLKVGRIIDWICKERNIDDMEKNAVICPECYDDLHYTSGLGLKLRKLIETAIIFGSREYACLKQTIFFDAFATRMIFKGLRVTKDI